ncbi:hypothetical protein [Helicobacter bilis]|nr:hypothetical protein [Helicobacter bilis]
MLKNTLKEQNSKSKSTQALKTICGTNLGSLIYRCKHCGDFRRS